MPDDHIDLFLQLSQSYEAALRYISTWDFIYQSVGLGIAVILSHWLAKLSENMPDHGGTILKKLKNNEFISFYEISFYAYILGLLWAEQSILTQFSVKPLLIAIILVVMFLIAMARISFVLARHSVQARAAIFVLWVIILLALFGSDAPAFEFLRKANVCVGDFKISLMFLIEAIFIFTVLLWASEFLSEIAKKYITASKALSPSYKVLYIKFSRIGLFTLSTLIGLTLLGIDITVLAVFTGALGLGLGMGLQRVFANFISGIILLLDKSIKPGDSLEVDGVRGSVDYMNARYVSIATAEGKNILIPNESMITEKVHNWSYETTAIQMKVSFMVAHGSDLDLVLKLTNDILNNNSEIDHSMSPNCLIGEFTDIGIRLDMRCWIDGSSTSMIKVKHDLLIEVWQTLKANDIELAQSYPRT